MDNLILEMLGYEEAGQVCKVKITGFNDNVCMSVKLSIPRQELIEFGAECQKLLQTPFMRQWGEEEGHGDCFKLMVRGMVTGSAEGRLYMKAAAGSIWSDTACFAIASTVGNFDAFGAAIPAFLEGDTGTVVALCQAIEY